MIVSHSGSFVFVKTRKTGGTSIEIVLSSWCKSGDICTPISPDDEVIRDQYGGAARGFCSDPLLEKAYVEAVQTADLAKISEVKAKLRPFMLFRNHMPAKELTPALEESWGSLKKFAVDRHPYEKVVSAAYFTMGRSRNQHKGIGFFIDKVIEHQSFLNYPLYTDSAGSLLVDDLVKYEDMWDYVRRLGTASGRVLPDLLPKAKSGFRKDRRDANKILTDVQKRKVADIASMEFELLGYAA